VQNNMRELFGILNLLDRQRFAGGLLVLPHAPLCMAAPLLIPS
jgi:hypothetical protein